MKVPERWLRAWCDPDLDAEALGQRLTMGGLEVESADPIAPTIEGVVMARVTEVSRHPDADRLTVCQVDCGESTPRVVVCGAPNVRAGLWTACALPGARLPGGLAIRATTMRGVESQGMLCSARELGINDDHGGLIEIDPVRAAEQGGAGSDLRRALALDERVFDLKVTPNLAHCLSVEGVARELSALSGTPWRGVDLSPLAPTLDERLPVRLEADDLCGRFTGRIIRGVDARAPTPGWIRERLERAGQRSISALVDLSNYVMLELGRPTHVFDLDKIAGGLTVRWGRAGESLPLLNGQTVDVGPRDGLSIGVIADERQVESLAGIMGGEATAVTLDTRNIYVEAAFWWPSAIAGRARLFNFSTDAAQRFERGVDFESHVGHLEYLSRLIVQTCGGAVGPVDDQIRRLPERGPVRLRVSRARKVSGIELSHDDCQRALGRLGLAPRRIDDDTLEITPPSRRFDLSIEEDLIEEVLRIHGFDRIAIRPPLAPARMTAAPESRLEPLALKRRWVERDYQEVITFSFVDAALDARFVDGVGAGAGRAGGSPSIGTRSDEEAARRSRRDPGTGAAVLEPSAAAAVRVLNPIASDLGVMRRSLWSGLVSTLVQNLNRKAERVRLFEFGRAFLRDPDAPADPRAVAGIRQPMRMAALAWGPVWTPQWGSPVRAVDFYDLKADLVAVCRHRGLGFESAGHPALHPGRSARVLIEDRPVGWIGALHPALAAQVEVDGEILLAELDLEPLLARDVPRPAAVSRFPPAIRDLAVVVAEGVQAGLLLDQIREYVAGEPLTRAVQHVRLFDEYRGKGLENKEKSLAFRFWMQDTERTLADAEVEAAMQAIVAFLGRQAGARLRG